jgi:hypothetical protein
VAKNGHFRDDGVSKNIQNRSADLTGASRDSRIGSADFTGGRQESRIGSADFAGGRQESRIGSADFAGGRQKSRIGSADFAGGRLESRMGSAELAGIRERRRAGSFPGVSGGELSGEGINLLFPGREEGEEGFALGREPAFGVGEWTCLGVLRARPGHFTPASARPSR